MHNLFLESEKASEPPARRLWEWNLNNKSMKLIRFQARLAGNIKYLALTSTF